MNQKAADLYKAVQDAGEEIVSLRTEIRAGRKTLGSKFDNFVFCSVGANPVEWEPFYNLNDQMTLSGGQEILIVRSEEKPYEPFVHHVGHGSGQFGCNGPSHESFMPPMKLKSIDYKMSYGVLTGKSLDFDLDGGEIIFPNGRKYVHASANSVFDTSLTFEPLEIKRGRIREKVGDLTHLYKSYSLEGLRFMGHIQTSQILVGPEVEEYFAELFHGAKAYSEIKKKL